ncbi:zinc carboxypeptidase [Nitzschia inconspicua]|uniref:Zinc carboxypeptidase n=1 Tax=Nitzschia inconspicua TaxID=303405 RepID=A0A9K3L4Z4_9STRA|nr:zinc carboxypeptidase [Nitzschia inconspicua]
MKSIVLAHVLLLSVWWTVAAVPGGVRSMKRQWDSSSIATTTGCFGPNGGVVIDTTRDVASRHSSQWDIQRKGSHRIHQTTSSNETNHVRLCVHLSDDSQLSEMQQLESQGALKIQSVVKVETSRQLRENSYDWKDFSCYSSVNETFTQVERLSTIYPDFVKVVSIGKSWWKTAGNAGHDIQVMVLTAPSTNATEKVPMMVIGGQHSRELPPPTLILQWAEYMLENYGKDADITWILDRTEIHLIPLANPDGREIVEQHMDWYYRKNARVTACDETKDYGVDLNRNYPMWYKTAGTRSSSDPCTSSYPGSGPLSEPESSAVYEYVHNLFPAHVKRAQNA